MKNHTLKKVSLLAVLIMIGGTGALMAQHEHPSEHPSAKTADAAPAVDKASLAAAIENYVESDAALKGGYFLFYDDQQQKTLELKLDHVHKDKLAHTKANEYFACADFRSKDGKLYDLDVFMNGDRADDLKVTQITVHKKEGEARYGWVYDKKGDVWRRQ